MAGENLLEEEKTTGQVDDRWRPMNERRDRLEGRAGKMKGKSQHNVMWCIFLQPSLSEMDLIIGLIVSGDDGKHTNTRQQIDNELRHLFKISEPKSYGRRKVATIESFCLFVCARVSFGTGGKVIRERKK